jgi:hypothetical protein
MDGAGLSRVATPGFCITDLLRTGVLYSDRSEFTRLMVLLAGCGLVGLVRLVGFELFHVTSETASLLASDIALACSKAGSSVTFTSLFAS